MYCNSTYKDTKKKSYLQIFLKNCAKYIQKRDTNKTKAKVKTKEKHGEDKASGKKAAKMEETREMNEVVFLRKNEQKVYIYYVYI